MAQGWVLMVFLTWLTSYDWAWALWALWGLSMYREIREIRVGKCQVVSCSFLSFCVLKFLGEHIP